MKKFISLALTAAMVASLVPATAFAKTQDGDIYHGTVSVVNAWNDNKKFSGDVNKTPTAPNYGDKNTPEAQIRITDVDYRGTDAERVARFTLRLDNAEFFTDAEVKDDAARKKFNEGVKVTLSPNGVSGSTSAAEVRNYWYEKVTDRDAVVKDLYDAYIANDLAGFASDYAGYYFIVAADKEADGATTPTATKWAGTEAQARKLGKAAALGLGVATTPGTGEKVPVIAANMNPSMGADYTTIQTTAGNTLDQVKAGLFKAFSAAGTGTVNASGALIAVGDEVWQDAGPTGLPGWVDKHTTRTFISEAEVVAWAKTNATAVETADTTLNQNVVPGVGISAADKIIAISPINKDFDTWKNSLTLTTTYDIAAEKSVKISDAIPDYGLTRKGMKAEIAELKDMKKNEITITVTNDDLTEGFLEKGDIISVDLTSILKNASKDAGFSITSSDIRLTNDNADFTYVNVDKEALQLSIRKVVDVAEDEVVTLDDKGLKIATNVGTFRTGADNQINLKISKGFEFVPKSFDDHDDWDIVARLDGDIVENAVVIDWDEDKTNKEELTLTVNEPVNEITVYGIDVKAASAKIDKVCTIKATSVGFNASAAVEVAKVVDYIVVLSVDEDEDVPVIYSGVDVDNTGLTDDSDHWSLDVTARESFPGAWSFRKGFNFELPDHVFVTDVEVISTENFLVSKGGAKPGASDVENTEVMEAFFNAYQNGNHVNFEFDKRVFDDVDAKLADESAEMTFRLQLVMDTGYEGDVALKLTGELLDEQEVTIAKFVKPYEVKAEQNDIIIDYRYTDIPTAISITEAEAGLWDKGKAQFRFVLENWEPNFFEFEGDPTYTVDSKSEMELKDAKIINGKACFTVDSESDEAATVEISGMQLFMNRSIPAGPYDLKIESTLDDAYHAQVLFAPDQIPSYNEATYANSVKTIANLWGNGRPAVVDVKEDSYIADVEDCATTVKEAFVNVVTAGRDVDDASFTTKVVVPVGENYIVAGEKQIELDTPAYINASGYTMLPIRAVATALGINNNNVLWDQPTRTVTILYGQRIITMTQGQKVVYVNGSAIPASAAVENTNSRTFLPMRDLATALGVTDIEWNQATRTATLNGNQKGNQ